MGMLFIGLEFRVGTTESVALINTATSILAIVTIAVFSLDKVYSKDGAGLFLYILACA